MFTPIEILLFNTIYVLIAYGAIIFQKMGAIRAPKIGEDASSKVLKGFLINKLWLIGTILNSAAIPVSFFLFSISNLSYLTIFHRAGIILIVAFGIKYLKEKITSMEIGGLILLYGGFIVLFLFIPQSLTNNYFISDVINITFIAICAMLLLAAYLVLKSKKTAEKVKELLLSSCAALAGIIGNVALRSIPLALSRDLDHPVIFNLFNFPQLGSIMVGIFLPGTPYFFGGIYFYCYMIFFFLNFLFIQMVHQYGRASVDIPLTNNLNFLVVMVFSYFGFQEPSNVFSWLGIGMMCSGMVLIGKIQTRILVYEDKDDQDIKLDDAKNLELEE